MAYETKPNTGSLFKNDRKESDSHPDYKGQAVIGGTDFWLDAWINESSAGVKYMAVKFKPKDQQQAPTAQQRPQPATFGADLDDDFVPF